MEHEVDKRVMVYPNYIDSTKTVSEGRMISKGSACPNPNVLEMMEACETLKLPAQIEDKHYPKAWWIRARLRVKIKDNSGMFLDPEVTSKQKLLVKLAQQVAKTPLRLKKGPAPMNILSMPTILAPGQRHPASGDADGAGSSKGATAAAGGGKKNKKGKK